MKGSPFPNPTLSLLLSFAPSVLLCVPAVPCRQAGKIVILLVKVSFGDQSFFCCPPPPPLRSPPPLPCSPFPLSTCCCVLSWCLSPPQLRALLAAVPSSADPVPIRVSEGPSELPHLAAGSQASGSGPVWTLAPSSFAPLTSGCSDPSLPCPRQSGSVSVAR